MGHTTGKGPYMFVSVLSELSLHAYMCIVESRYLDFAYLE